MFESEIAKYQSLNKLASQHGTVILGGTDDLSIPLGELKQAFALEGDLYNRSMPDLTVSLSAEVFDACIKALNPETVLLHIGAADLKSFGENSSAFDQAYRDLIGRIRAVNRKCRIAVISLRNPEERTDIAELNKHLKYLADAERCEYSDITVKRIWNPKETKEVMSFLYSTGFVRPLNVKRPLYDLVKILFCYDPACIA
ncbi:MAG: SGNH/GDSL hydrolase family protein [Clostridia bacterium]|nr:SGNH/GDSL hydrolase family protein [Clostridia bacterium]